MNVFKLISLSFSVIFNLWFSFKTSGKNDFLLVKKITYNDKEKLIAVKPSRLYLQTKEHVQSAVVAKDQQQEDSYLIFTAVLAIMSIGIEFVLTKNAKLIKKNNESLIINNRVMIKQNADLHHAFAALEENTEENSRMLQVIAHDLRSPMAAIVGLSGFMIDEHNLADEDMEVIHLIHTSGTDSLKFISEILERESTKTELKKEVVDLHVLLIYCIAQLQYKANEKFQEIRLESTITTKLRLNREKIWRVISNIISNALKFSPAKSCININLNLTDEKAIISIKDYGIGIPENLGDKIFGMSSTRKREGTAGEKSFGMGLAICKQNVEVHGGSLSFVSNLEKGTTFFIELPLLST